MSQYRKKVMGQSSDQAFSYVTFWFKYIYVIYAYMSQPIQIFVNFQWDMMPDDKINMFHVPMSQASDGTQSRPGIFP